MVLTSVRRKRLATALLIAMAFPQMASGEEANQPTPPKSWKPTKLETQDCTSVQKTLMSLPNKSSLRMMQNIIIWKAADCPFPWTVPWETFDDKETFFAFLTAVLKRKGKILFLRDFGLELAKESEAKPDEDRVTSKTDCKNYKPKELFGDTKCEILKGVQLDAEGKALDAELAMLRLRKALIEKEKVCKELLGAAPEGKAGATSAPPPIPGEFCVKARSVGLKVPTN